MRMLLGAVLIGVLTSTASAQEFVVSQAPREVPVVQEPAKLSPTTAGIVTQIFNVKKPWQMLNPKAPKEYGDGRENVSYSEKDPGKPKGFILFAFEW